MTWSASLFRPGLFLCCAKIRLMTFLVLPLKYLTRASDTFACIASMQIENCWPDHSYRWRDVNSILRKLGPTVQRTEVGLWILMQVAEDADVPCYLSVWPILELNRGIWSRFYCRHGECHYISIEVAQRTVIEASQEIPVVDWPVGRPYQWADTNAEAGPYRPGREEFQAYRCSWHTNGRAKFHNGNRLVYSNARSELVCMAKCLPESAAGVAAAWGTAAAPTILIST